MDIGVPPTHTFGLRLRLVPLTPDSQAFEIGFNTIDLPGSQALGLGLNYTTGMFRVLWLADQIMGLPVFIIV